MKNIKALYLLITANVVSGFAQGISMLAIPWYFVDILNSGSTFGLIYAITTFLSLFWSIYAGTLIDRYPRKNIFLGITTVGMLFLGSVAASGFIYGEVPLLLVALVFGFTMFNYQLHYPALYAFGQEITEKKFYGRTNSILEIQGQSTNVLAGAFAAVLLSGIGPEMFEKIGLEGMSIAPWSLHEIFLMDACTYLVAFSIILMIKYEPIVKKEVETGKMLKRIKTGFLFLKKNPLLFLFGNSSYSLFVVLLVELHFLLPMYVDNHLERGAGIYALAEVLYAFGALSAGIWIRKIFRNTTYVKGIIILMALASMLFFLCFSTKSVFVFCVFNFFIGISNAGTRVLRITYLFNHIPNNVIGRTNSVFQMINIILRFTFISIFSLRYFSTDNNVIWAYFLSGLFVLISAIPLLMRYKKLTSNQSPHQPLKYQS